MLRASDRGPSSSRPWWRALLVGVGLLALTACKREAAKSEAPDFAGFELPDHLDTRRGPAQLCPELEACREQLPGWIAACEDEAGDAPKPGRGEACYLASRVTGITAEGPPEDPEAYRATIRRYADLACEQGHAEACAWAAELHTFEATEEDLATAKGQAERACAGASGAGCVLEALYLLDDPETREGGEAALVHMCEERELGRACGELGVLYLDGSVLAQSVNDSLRYAEAGCDLDYLGACSLYAKLVFRFESLADLWPGALEKADHACAGGLAESCAQAAVLYELNRTRPGLPAGWDDAHMIASLERGCEELRDAESCVFLADMLSEGVEGLLEADPQRAAELYQRACEHGHDGGCLRFGVLLTNSGDRQQAEFGLRIVQELCVEGQQAACAALPPELRPR